MDYYSTVLGQYNDVERQCSIVNISLIYIVCMAHMLTLYAMHVFTRNLHKAVSKTTPNALISC